MNTDLSKQPSEKSVILLAEDDVDQSEMLRERLEEEGYSVETAFRGDKAMQCLRDHKYAVAIMDARMPGLHGGTVLKICKILGAMSRTPVIMVSAFATPEDIEKYRCDGAIACFAKPLNMKSFLNFVRNVTAR